MKQTRNPQTKVSDLYSKINTTLVFLFILFLPTQLGRHFFLPFSYLSGVRVDYLAPTIYVTDLIVFFLILINSQFILSIFKKKSVLLFFLMLALTVIFAQSFPIAFYQYLKIMEVFIVGIITYKRILEDRLVLIGFLITGGVQLVLSLLQLFTKHSLQGVFYFLGERYMSLSMPGIAKASIQGVELLRPYGTFSHPNSLAGFFLVLYICVLVDKRFTKFLLLKYASLFVFSLLVLISFSKVAIFTYIILNFYFLFLISRIPCQFCKWARLIILIVVALLFIQARTDPLTLQKRLELVNNSLHIIFQYPITGVGPGNYLIAQNQYSSKFAYFFNQPVHNIFLLFLAETGILFGGFILFICIRFFKKWLHFQYILIIVAICITGLFDHYWLTLQQNILLLGFTIGASLKRRA